VLRSWLNDLTPPRFRLLTKRVTAGRPLLAARVTDLGSGVDPLSLVIEYRNNVLLGASLYDPSSGLALFGIPRTAPPVRHGLFKGAALAADNRSRRTSTRSAPTFCRTRRSSASISAARAGRR
jgi:hypothetical protein